jgi:hypothetical protein
MTSIEQMRASIVVEEAIKHRPKTIDALRRTTRLAWWVPSILDNAIDRNIAAGVFVEGPRGELLILRRAAA